MLDDLRALVEFAHAGSIAGAADRLFRTPSAITRQVQRLEAALGAELLDRSVKPPRLNSLGARVLEQARDLLQRTEKVKPRLRPFSRTSSRLTVWRSFKAPQATWTVTGKVWAKHPGCSIRSAARFGPHSSIGWSVTAAPQ